MSKENIDRRLKSKVDTFVGFSFYHIYVIQNNIYGGLQYGKTAEKIEKELERLDKAKIGYERVSTLDKSLVFSV